MIPDVEVQTSLNDQATQMAEISINGVLFMSLQMSLKIFLQLERPLAAFLSARKVINDTVFLLFSPLVNVPLVLSQSFGGFEHFLASLARTLEQRLLELDQVVVFRSELLNYVEVVLIGDFELKLVFIIVQGFLVNQS